MNKRYILTPDDRERQQEYFNRTIRMEEFRPDRFRRHRISGNDGPGSSEYQNYFKVIPGSEPDTVTVVDGARPEYCICGKTDCGEVEAAVLAMHYRKSLYLILEYDAAEKRYRQSFWWEDDPLPAGDFGTTLIATVSEDGKIIQRHSCGMIYWSERYFV